MTNTTWDELRARAPEFAAVTLATTQQEFPNHIRHVMREPGDFPHRPRDIYPAFYGCFDWHSCVEMHWVLVKLVKDVPDVVPAAEIRAVLDEHLTAGNLLTEAKTFTERGGGTRPYGWAWALHLIHELATWDDPDAQRWAANAEPLGDALAGAFVRWLPTQTYPIRQGAHFNSAFGLSRALAHARLRAERGDPALLDAITDAALRWFTDDVDSPARWEPDGADFLSPTLCEAELMASVLPETAFPAWLDRFRPDIATVFEPAVVSDDTDGQTAHLHGLNLSRAWCFRRLAETLTPNDSRSPELLANARRHAARALDKVSGTDYMVEHWLACYAVLYLHG